MYIIDREGILETPNVYANFVNGNLRVVGSIYINFELF